MTSDGFYRQIACVALLQIVLIVGSWVALAVVMKFEGYPDDNPFVRFKPVPIALREHGAWALLVPLVYVVAACIAGESPQSTNERIGYIVQSLCFVASLCLMSAFLVSAARPYSRGLLIWLG